MTTLLSTTSINDTSITQRADILKKEDSDMDPSVIKNAISINDHHLSFEESDSLSVDSITSDQSQEELEEMINLFNQNIHSSKLDSHSSHLVECFNEALLENSKITMLPNYNIQPTGNEQGDYLVIDVGGSTLRIAVISIDPPPKNESCDRSNRIHCIIEKKWEIDDSFKMIDLNFFKWIGSKIEEILNNQKVISLNSVINTGITWSFPLTTTAHNNGRINFVAKGYTISPEIHNHDLKEILESCMNLNFNIQIDIKVIVNDSLAVYAAGTFIDKYTKLAMVLGTGFNMCCSLPTNKMHLSKRIDDEKAVLLNTELSLFGSSLLDNISNKYDEIIDSRFKYNLSNLHFKPHMTVDPVLNTLFQPLELMTSGRYLPELTRLMLSELIELKKIFKNQSDFNLLSKEYIGFTGELMCYISETNDYDLIKLKLESTYNWSNISNDDIIQLKKLIDCVIKRAAFIVAASIISFIKLFSHHQEISNDENSKLIKIGYVGSVLLYFHSYRNLILEFVNKNEAIKNLNIKIDFKWVENSSIVGAAIGAAYYNK